MKTKPTLTIGIVAYNEAANIGRLLAALKNQDIESADLLRTVVISDASTDDTDDIVRTIGGKRVLLIRHPKRSGANEALNTLIKNVTSDLLAIFDADVLPENNHIVENLIRPFVINDKIGLTSGMLIPAKPLTLVEQVLARTHVFKTEFFSKLPSVNYIYLSVGPIRAVSRNFYSLFYYPDQVPNDAYAYLKCRKIGLAFEYVPSARVIFRCPSTLKDHDKQSSRFASGRQQLIEEFNGQAKAAYALPLMPTIIAVAGEAIRHPIMSFFVGYFALFFYTKMIFKQKQFTSKWDVAASSKKI